MASPNLTPESPQTHERVVQIQTAQRQFGEVSNSVASLRTEADRATGLLGFGRRILVPPDEIHVVVGDGYHVYSMSNERKVYGQSANRPAKYWLNSHTQVIKLKTISFTVPIRGNRDEGVEALDKNKVSFRLWAHAVAKLNPDKADVAAQRVGADAGSLVNTITEVGTAELIAAAATMELETIIADRQQLAVIASPKVNEILSELGYDLALLTITELDGVAYRKMVEQAEAGISKETSIATNREQLEELKDRQARERTEAEVSAITEKKLAAERLEAEQEVQTATLSQQEQLAMRRHDINVQAIARQRLQTEAQHGAELATVQLSQKIGAAEAEKEAQLARMKAEREAELRALAQKRQAEITLAQAEAEAKRDAVAQAKAIERRAELTQAEAERLREEELAKANRAREIALVEANQLAEAMKVEAEADALALNLRTDADAKATLTKAEAQATAAEKQAQAAKIRAEAVRAEQAAPGLAEAEVDEAQLQVAEQQVLVTRAEGLAQAEVARAQAEAEIERQKKLKIVEIEAQEKLATLYETAPILIDLEKLRMEFTHQKELTQIQANARLKMFEAIAPTMKVHLYGSGGQMSEILTQMMSFSQGLQVLGEEVPAFSRLTAPNENGVMGSLQALLPAVRNLLANSNPRMISSLSVNDVVEKLAPVVSGEANLMGALTNLKQNASFRVIGDMPVAPILNLMGVEMPANDANDNLEVVDIHEA